MEEQKMTPPSAARFVPRDEQERDAVVKLAVNVAVASASEYGFNLFSEKIRPIAERFVEKVPPAFRRVPLDGTRELGVAALGSDQYPIVFNIYTCNGQPHVSANSPYSFRALLETARTDDDRFMLARAACDLQAQPYEVKDEPAAPTPTPGVVLGLFDLTIDEIESIVNDAARIRTEDIVADLRKGGTAKFNAKLQQLLGARGRVAGDVSAKIEKLVRELGNDVYRSTHEYEGAPQTMGLSVALPSVLETHCGVCVNGILDLLDTPSATEASR